MIKIKRIKDMDTAIFAWAKSGYPEKTFISQKWDHQQLLVSTYTTFRAPFIHWRSNAFL